MPPAKATHHDLQGQPLRVDESTTGKHIPALDGIRGLAILLVFALHFFWGNFYYGHNPVIWLSSQIRNIGWAGVDVFFVLSGFLITGILYDTLHSHHFFRNFYARRAVRIFPLYYGFLIFVLVLTIATGYKWSPTGFLVLFTYTGAILQHPLSSFITTMPWVTFNHFWTLQIEEEFYLVWPLCVFLLRTKRRIAIAAFSGAMASVLLRLYLSHSYIWGVNSYTVSTWTPCRLDGLLLGACLAMLIRSRYEKQIIRFASKAFLLGVFALCIMAWKEPRLDFLHSKVVAVWGILLFSLTFAAMLAASLRRGSVSERVLSQGWLRFFGRYSYGLYVFHYEVATQMERLRPWIRQHTHSALIALSLPAVLGILITIGIAVLSFRFFELPFLRLKRYFTNDARQPKLSRVVR